MTPEEVAGGYEYRGKIQITEGNHRVAAALKYQVTHGSDQYLKYLIAPGIRGSVEYNTPFVNKLYRFKIK